MTDRIGRNVALAFYYAIGWRFPTQPMVGWRLGYWLRRRLLEIMVPECGRDVIVKQRAYIGRAEGLRIGDRTQLGDHVRLGPGTWLGSDVVMGPYVDIQTTAHEYRALDTPINRQSARPIRPVIIEDDVWLGTGVVVLPGVRIGRGAIVGANAVVTKDIPAAAVAVGVPARVVKYRGED